MKDKRYLTTIVAVLVCTLLAVSIYGIGQKYLGFPAFLTMNEEFAKGIPIRLSPLSRISSTFGGHYDLAAYLVLVLPILVSMIFGFRNLFVRGVLVFSALLGFIVLFMTVSRISFLRFFVAGFCDIYAKEKAYSFSIPVIVLITLLFVSISPSIYDRFGNTIKAIDVVVDAKTGEAIGHTQEVPNTYFATKIVKQQYARTIQNIYGYASPSASFVVPYLVLPEKVVLLVEPNAPTGEDLPQDGYINLSLAPIMKKLNNFFMNQNQEWQLLRLKYSLLTGISCSKKCLPMIFRSPPDPRGWPRAMAAFTRNILVGSGYGSVGLAVDNSYLRMLAEVGLLGFASFLAIFIVIGIYIRKILPSVDSVAARSFVIGFVAGLVGLAVNALFIDVFEASKVAFVTWLLAGFTLGLLRLYQRKPLDMYKEFQRIATSTPAIAVYIFLLTFLLYSPMTRNNFVGDDFTWFRWVADRPINAETISRYFTQSEGFFYRPGTKIYFLIMYTVFWLNQNAYHMVSLVLHCGSTACVSSC